MTSRKVSGEGQRRQGIDGPLDIEQLGIGVRVHRQIDRTVTHGGLCCTGGNSTFGEQSSERRAQGVNVDCPAPFVAFGDASGLQVPVENPNQPGGNREQLSGRVGLGVVISQTQCRGLGSIGQPLPQVSHQIGPERDS